MFVAGIPVRADSILELARLVDDPELADKLENAYGRDVKILALRAVLLQEHVWRQREGL